MAERYRSTRPFGGIELEANQVTPENVAAVALWCRGVEVTEFDAIHSDISYAAINVPTEYGFKRAQEGDWVIKRPSGDFYRVDNERFKALFELVVD